MGDRRSYDTNPENDADEGLSPDAQPTQEYAVPRNASGADPVENGERLALLQRLSSTELTVLRHRCSGATTSQIATHLGIPHAEARAHAANLLDKLGVTYGREGTSLSRLTAFCPLTSQLGASAGRGGAPIEPPSGQPSQRATELTDADDRALLSQHGGAPPPTGNDGRQRWIIGGALVFVLVATLLVLLFVLDDDDDEDDATAEETATEEVATETAIAALEPTETVEEPTATPEPEPTETDVPATDTPDADDEEETEVAATETAEAEPEPTETEVPHTETPVPAEPTATEVSDEPEPTATEQEQDPEPTPDDSQLDYEADWSSGDDDWILTDGWTIEDGTLVTTGDAAPLMAPFEPEQPHYAVEIEMTITSLIDCEGRAGVFARVSEESNPDGDALVGYAGTVCEDEWHIDAVLEDDRDSLASGDRTLERDEHLYRIEVAGEQIRFYVDDEFVGDATDDRWDEAGSAGIYVDGDVEVTISAFRVFALDDTP